MSRVRVMSALAYDLLEYEGSGLADPRIVMMGELPGVTRPFEIARVFKGSQGRYEEFVAIADASGTVVWQSNPRVIELRGEMFEDLFRTQVRHRLPITSTDEHTLLMYIDGNLAARVPVFIHAPDSVAGEGVFTEATQAALKKSAVCWITIPQGKKKGSVTRPAWYVQQGASLFVLKGGDEQELPGLENAQTVTLTIKSKDIKSTIGTTEADVRIVTDDDEFERIAAIGMGTRLNLKDGERALERWKQTCVLAEITPRR
ncbi:MAG: hypothetical protein WD576_02625 [Nitriliruptoraceae bacterium]